MKNPNNINGLINSLIKSFKEYDKSLKNKIRVNSIFSSLDENTSKNFGKLINLSELRYKSVKSGVKLNNILKAQKPRYEYLIEELKNDKLYSTNSLEKEKDKLFKSSVMYKNKEILEIRNKLKDSLKPKQNKYKIKNKIYPTSKEKLPKLRNIIKKVANLAHLNEFLKNKIENIRLEKLNEQLTDTLLQEDYKNFHDKICSYQNFLNKIRNLSENNSGNKRLKIDKNIFKDTIESMNPNSFRALSYTENLNKKNTNIKKKDLEFDLHKIKNIKMSHDKNYNIINHYKYFKTFNTINDKQIQSQKKKSIQLLKKEEDDDDKNILEQKGGIFEIKDYKEKNNDFIRKKFQEIYEQKKLKWKKEDKLYELKKEMDKKNKLEIEDFLFEVQDKHILKRQKFI